MLSIFSRAFWISICLLWRKLNANTKFNWGPSHIIIKQCYELTSIVFFFHFICVELSHRQMKVTNKGGKSGTQAVWIQSPNPCELQPPFYKHQHHLCPFPTTYLFLKFEIKTSNHRELGLETVGENSLWTGLVSLAPTTWDSTSKFLYEWCKIARRNINNLRYVDDTTLMAEREEELKSLLMKVEK